MHRNGALPARIGPDLEGRPVGHDLDVAIEVGPEDGHVREGGERLRRGMPVLVVDSGGDDRDTRTEGVEKLGDRRRMRPVVPDLEQVDRPERPTRDQRRLDRCLGVAAEERAEGAVADLEHHRSVVDVAVGEGSARIGVGGVEDAQDGRRVEGDVGARAGQHDGDAGGGRIGQKPPVRRIVECDAGVNDGAHSKTIENLDQAGDVVLVRVAQDEQVDPASVEGQVRADAPQGELGVWATVDEHGGAVRRLDQDGVALANREHCDVEASVGSRRERDGEQHGHHGTQDWQRVEETRGDGGCPAGACSAPARETRSPSCRRAAPRCRVPGGGTRRWRRVPGG